jgi:hypothetical protein
MTRTTRSAKRTQKSLTSRLDKRLLGYSAAATAAGVGLLAASTNAEAKVVYTAANIKIVTNGGPVYLDINNDGVADFALQSSTYSAGRVFRGHEHPVKLPFFQDLLAAPQQAGDGVVGYIDTSQGLDVGCAAAMPAGVKVGANAKFLASNRIMLESEVLSYSYGHDACNWGRQHRGAYLGVKFSVNGETHYGWAHIAISTAGTVITGYAYETVANQPISTGKTSGPVSVGEFEQIPAPQGASLGALALGATGLQIWRRPEEGQA